MLSKEVANLVLDFKTMKGPCDRAWSYVHTLKIHQSSLLLGN